MKPRSLRLAALLGLCLLLGGCQGLFGSAAPPTELAGATAHAAGLLAPPVAPARPVRLERHGVVRTDEYYWLRERADPEVVAYLDAENAYTRAVMAHTEELQEELFQEIKGRVKQDDSTVPYKKGAWFYYTRFEDGRDYPLHCRRKGSLDAPEQVLLDGNALAAGHDYFEVCGFEPGNPAVTPDGRVLAFAVDTVGRRIYTVRFKNLETGALSPEEIRAAAGAPAATGDMVWAADNRTLFYTRQDPVTLRPFQVYRHTLGSDPAGDVLVYEETDPEFGVDVSTTRSERYLLIASRQTASTEYRFLPADDPTGTFRVFLGREAGHEHSLDHHGGEFFVLTNWEAQNFRLMAAPAIPAKGDGPAADKKAWREVVPHREDVLLEDFELFEDYLVLAERQAGLTRLRIRELESGAEHEITFDDAAYAAWLGVNAEPNTAVVRFVYSSLATPESTYDYDMASRTRTLLKRDEVLGGFEPGNYETERIQAPARDGEHVPVSILYRGGLERDGRSPVLLYGYGSYGASMDAEFDPNVLSLVDRGFVYAIAHVRGGEELGRRWYEDGKLLKKKNTFNDFIDCAEHLIAEGYTASDRLFAAGGSAGGLLIGAAVNMRPELFAGAVAEVPFVDVVTTMLDETIPLTTAEYDEWGDPNDQVFFDYMLSYSPYDNVAAHDYPHLLVTAGLHDSQVQYFEPAKWVARMRARKTGDSRLLLKTNMQAGHGGASARTEAYREAAFICAFLLDLAPG